MRKKLEAVNAIPSLNIPRHKSKQEKYEELIKNIPKTSRKRDKK